jgi:hypothetical protein
VPSIGFSCQAEVVGGLLGFFSGKKSGGSSLSQLSVRLRGATISTRIRQISLLREHGESK